MISERRTHHDVYCWQDARLHQALARQDAQSNRLANQPDLLSLYHASPERGGRHRYGGDSLGAGYVARRRLLPKSFPSAALASIEPKAAIAELAAHDAAISADPLRNGKYASLMGAPRDESIGDFLGSMAFRGKPVARRGAKYIGQLT